MNDVDRVPDDIRQAVIEKTLFKKKEEKQEKIDEKDCPESSRNVEKKDSNINTLRGLLEQSLENRAQQEEQIEEIDEEVRKVVIESSRVDIVGDLLKRFGK